MAEGVAFGSAFCQVYPLLSGDHNHHWFCRRTRMRNAAGHKRSGPGPVVPVARRTAAFCWLTHVRAARLGREAPRWTTFRSETDHRELLRPSLPRHHGWGHLGRRPGFLGSRSFTAAIDNYYLSASPPAWISQLISHLRRLRVLFDRSICLGQLRAGTSSSLALEMPDLVLLRRWVAPPRPLPTSNTVPRQPTPIFPIEASARRSSRPRRSIGIGAFGTPDSFGSEIFKEGHRFTATEAVSHSIPPRPHLR